MGLYPDYIFMFIFISFLYIRIHFYIWSFIRKKYLQGRLLFWSQQDLDWAGQFLPYKCSVPLNRDDIFYSNKWLALTLSYSVVCDFILCKYFLNFNNYVDFFAYERLPGCKLPLGTTHEKHLVLLTCPVPPPSTARPSEIQSERWPGCILCRIR